MEQDNRDEPANIEKKVRTFKIQIDKIEYEVSRAIVTGNDLLNNAGKQPVEQFAIYLKSKGSQPIRIGPNENVDISEPGKERFVTLPLDQTEG